MIVRPDVLRPESAEEVREMVLAHRRLVATGGGTKLGLAGSGAGESAEAARLDLRALSGVAGYQPGEFVVTARAGTALAELQALLAEHGQYLPFDPPRAAAGATLGGTVAAGLSGSGRYRYGGLRDFVIGVVFVDGRGRRVHGGGKVVKNAAGFDLPKLLAGSLGRLGVLLEVSLKVFPRPPARWSARLEAGGLGEAVELLRRLGARDWGLEALDLLPPATLELCLAGGGEGLAGRLERLESFLERPLEPIEDAETHWAQVAALAPAAGGTVVKVPITPKRIPAFEVALESFAAPRRYAGGGQVAWLEWPAAVPLGELEAVLRGQGLAGLNLDRVGAPALLGEQPGRPFLARVKSALDPDGRFPPL